MVTQENARKVTRMREYARQCNGSENFYRHMLAKRMLYTDGVKELATVCEAWWLVDAIAAHMATNATLAAEEFITWSLRQDGNGAKLVATNGNDDVGIVQQRFNCTDFPVELMPFRFFSEKGADTPGKPLVHTLMLPEER